MLTNAQLIAAALKEQGVQYVFGVPGGEVLDLIEAMQEIGIRFVLVRHESAAAFMADALFCLTGIPGVVLTTLGPGAANAMLGMANAYLERSAVIILTGNVSTSQLPPYTHQVIDVERMFAPVCKWSHTLSAESAASAVRNAVNIALSGVPGPVHLNVPMDVAKKPATSVYAGLSGRVVSDTQMAPGSEQCIVERLRSASRPLAVVGVGALLSGSAHELKEFAEAWQVPCVTTYKAKGIIPEDHPLSLGAAGLSGVVDKKVFGLVERSDLILTIGFDAVEMRSAWVDCWPAEKVVRLDETADVHLVYGSGVEVVAHLPSVLAQLTHAAKNREYVREPSPRAICRAHREDVSSCLAAAARCGQAGMSPYAAIRVLREVFPKDTIATADTGAHRILLNHAWDCYQAPGLLQSTGLGSMGVGMPYAVGAKIASPNRPVVAFVGDAGLLMYPGDLSVAVELGLAITVVVFSDNVLSLIALKQQREAKQEAGVRLGRTDFVKLAEALGGTGTSVSTEHELRTAAQQALKSVGVNLIEVRIDPTEYGAQV